MALSVGTTAVRERDREMRIHRESAREGQRLEQTVQLRFPGRCPGKEPQRGTGRERLDHGHGLEVDPCADAPEPAGVCRRSVHVVSKPATSSLTSATTAPDGGSSCHHKQWEAERLGERMDPLHLVEIGIEQQDDGPGLALQPWPAERSRGSIAERQGPRRATRVATRSPSCASDGGPPGLVRLQHDEVVDVSRQLLCTRDVAIRGVGRGITALAGDQEQGHPRGDPARQSFDPGLVLGQRVAGLCSPTAFSSHLLGAGPMTDDIDQRGRELVWIVWAHEATALVVDHELLRPTRARGDDSPSRSHRLEHDPTEALRARGQAQAPRAVEHLANLGAREAAAPWSPSTRCRARSTCARSRASSVPAPMIVSCASGTCSMHLGPRLEQHVNPLVALEHAGEEHVGPRRQRPWRRRVERGVVAECDVALDHSPVAGFSREAGRATCSPLAPGLRSGPPNRPCGRTRATTGAVARSRTAASRYASRRGSRPVPVAANVRGSPCRNASAPTAS